MSTRRFLAKPMVALWIFVLAVAVGRALAHVGLVTVLALGCVTALAVAGGRLLLRGHGNQGVPARITVPVDPRRPRR